MDRQKNESKIDGLVFDRVLVLEINKPLTEEQLKELEIARKRMRVKIIENFGNQSPND